MTDKLPEINGWQIKRIQDISEVIGGSTPSTFESTYWEGDIPFVTPTDITSLKNSNYIKKTRRYITEKGLNAISSDLLEPGTILLTSRATLGEVAINKVPLVTNQGFANIKPHSDINGLWLLHYLRAQKRELERLSSGSTFKEISKKSIKRMKIPVPPLVEQCGIVEVLGTVDECIRLTDAVIERAEELKRGLMQQLLTRGIGHTEYKETSLGEIPKTWKIVNLNDVSMRFISGGTPDTNNDQYWGGDIHWMKSAYIKGKIINCGEKFITLKGLKNSASNIIPKNNILIATRVSLGNVAVNNIDIAISQDLTGIVLNKNLIDKNFLYWLLFNSRNRILSLQQGTTIKGILRNDLEKLKILLPSLKEQRKISYILDLLDSNININFIKKEKLNMLKQGIMQILLSGKVRVELKGDGLHRIRCGRETHN